MILDYHNYTLDWYERHQDALEAIDLSMPDTVAYMVTAFSGPKEEWYDYAYNEDELDGMKRDAEDRGFTVTVKELL